VAPNDEKYAMPVLIAGISIYHKRRFLIKILLERAYCPHDISRKSEVGKYAACYKLALFMTRFCHASEWNRNHFFLAFDSKKPSKGPIAQSPIILLVLGSVNLLLAVGCFLRCF